MKCIEKDGKVLKVSNRVAEHFVIDKGYSYVEKGEFRKQDPKRRQQKHKSVEE
jgi:hypothetical protein